MKISEKLIKNSEKMSGALLDILLIEKNESILQDYCKIKRNIFPTTKEWDYLIDNK